MRVVKSNIEADRPILKGDLQAATVDLAELGTAEGRFPLKTQVPVPA